MSDHDYWVAIKAEWDALEWEHDDTLCFMRKWVRDVNMGYALELVYGYIGPFRAACLGHRGIWN